MENVGKSKLKEAEEKLSFIELDVDAVKALAFVTWDSFTNGEYQPEIESYAPALRVLMEQADKLHENYKKAMDAFGSAVKGSVKNEPK